MDKVNNQGLTLKDYVEPIRATVKKESMYLLDLFQESCFFAKEDVFKSTYTNNSDGLHPNELWQEILGLRKVLSFLNMQ